MANDFNASLVISTSDAVTNVKNLDGASKDLDKTLAHLHSTMQSSQGDIDKVAKSLKVFTDSQRQAIQDQKAKDQALITSSRLEREQLVTKAKGIELTTKQAEAEGKLANVKSKGGQSSAAALGTETRRNLESTNRATNATTLTTARATTEAERLEGQTHRTAAAIATRAGAESRAELSALRLADAQQRSANSSLALNDSLSNSRYLLYDVGATYGVLSAALLAIPAATTAVASSYEKDFTQVVRTTGVAGDAASGLYQELKQLGSQIPLSFGEFANIASIAGQLGIAQSEIGAFTESVAKFGAASNVATADAATAFGRLENSFNADGKIPDFFNRVGSAIVKVGINSAASETEIIAVTNQISAAGAQFGFTADQIVGLSGALASVRIRPELARGAFQRIMLNLSSAADQGAASFDKFAKYTSVSGDAAIKLFKTDPSAFFQQYINGLKGTIDKGTSVSAVLDDIGAKNVFDKQFILGLANGIGVYNKALGDSASAFKDGTFLNENTKATFETFSAMLTRIGTALSSFGANLGGGNLKPLEDLAHVVLDVVSAADRMVTQVPAIRFVIDALLGLGAVTGVLLALKSAQAFVLAGLVGMQQVMGKASIAGALTLRGNVSELAKTMLMAKGASAEYATTLLANKTAMQQLGAATMTTRAEVAAGAAAVQSGAVITRNAGAATGGFVTGMKSMGSAALGLVGGPLGALVLGLGVVITQLISTGEEAAQAGEAIARAMKNGSDATLRAAADSLSKIKVSPFDGIAVGNVDKTLVEVAKNAGVSFEKLALAATKGRDAGKAALAVMDEVARSKGFKDFAALQSGSFGSQNHKGELEYLKQKVEDIGNASGKSAEGAKAADDAVKGLGQSANGAAPDASALGEGLDKVGTSAKTAADKIKEAVDAIFGLVDAEAATQGALGKLGAGLQDSTSFDTGSDGGRNNLSNFHDALRSAAQEQQQLIDSGKQTAQEAAANYTAFIDGLMQELASRGVDVGQIQDLANQAKGVFGTTFASGDQPTITPKVDAAPVLGEVTATAQTLQEIVKSNGANFAVGANTVPFQTNISFLAQALADITGLPYQVVVDALTDPANAKSVQVYDLLTSITNGTYVAPVDADTSAAIANVQNFVAYARTELSHLQSELNGGVGYGDGEGSMSPAQKNQYSSLGAPKVVAPSAPAIAAPAQVRAPAIAAPNFGGLVNGYNDAAKAAKGAGDAGKKAGNDMANGIDDATAAATDYASRLKTGLQSAFDKQYGMQKAADDYHSALNAITKKHEDELQQLDDLIAKQKELSTSRDAELVKARKAGTEKAISQKYGEANRAFDYATQEQDALNAVDAKNKDIAANDKTAKSLRDGMDDFTSNSDAAIANREALRNLESKMLDMISAYAATGASQEQVRAYAQKLTAQFRLDEDQVWRNRVQVQLLQGDLGRYVAVINAVPQVKPTTVTANTGQAMGAIGGVQNALNGLHDREVGVTLRGGMVFDNAFTSDNQPIYRVIDRNGERTNVRLFNKGGEVPGFAGGGMIPGQSPADPSVDNMFAKVDGKGMIKVRSGEFIVQQPAVDYWGLDFFKNLNNMKMPAFNGGGSVGGGNSGGSGASNPVLVELTADNIQAILRLADRPVDLYAGIEKLASTVNKGNVILASKGVS